MLDTVTHIDNGTRPNNASAVKWGFYHGNNEGNLPNGRYKEYRVLPEPGSRRAGPRRVVENTLTGDLYYTWNHYGQGESPNPPFVRIR